MARVPATLPALLGAVAAGDPDRLACLLPGSSGRGLTFAGLDVESRRVAGGLRGLGLRRGDRMGVWLPTLPEWFVLQFAAARLGVIVVALNPRYRTKELVDVLGTAEASAVVVPTQFLGVDHPRLLADAVPDLPSLRSTVLVGDAEPAGPPAGLPGALPYAALLGAQEVDDAGVSGDDLAVIFTTSGTTSSPKLAVHAQAGVVQHAVNVAAAYDLHPGDVSACALPMAGVFGFSTALGALAGGATCLLQPAFDPQQVAEWLAAGEVTHFNAADNMLTAVLDALDAGSGPVRARWRDGGFASFSGGGADLVRRAERQPGLRLTGLYGASEGFALAARWPRDAPVEERARAGGIPISADIQVRAADPDTGEVLAAEQPGELQFRGYNVCREYYANPAATSQSRTSDGWFRSGDLGFTLDRPGFVYLSRLKDTLRLRGFLTDPAEIEEFLATHSAVQLAQVVGVSRPGEGDVAVAFVQLRDGASVTPQELQEHCREQLANYKVPAEVVLVDRFPTVTGPNGEKIQKNRLRDEAAALLG